MSVLYQKALTIRYQEAPPRPAVPAVVEGDASDGITTEEREKISAHIDGIMAKSRVPVSPETLTYTPKRRGAVLPVVANIAVLVVFLAAGFVVAFLLNHQEQFIATGESTEKSAEGKLIAALKEESDQQLREKDRAIVDAQQKLQTLSDEEAQLRGQTDSIVKSREQELQTQFDQKLADEKARLEQLGLSAAAEADKLRQFEAARRQDMEKQLAAARQQAESELAAKTKAISERAARYQQDLDAARQDRARMQTDYSQKEATLRSQYAQNLQAAQAEKAGVSDELARLRAQRDKEQLSLDQILTGDQRVDKALAAADYPEALRGLDSMRAYLEEPTVAALPSIQKRRPVELFLMGSLNELIHSRQSPAPADASITEATAQLQAVSDLVAHADSLAQSGNLAAARDAYTQALRQIPSVARGYSRVEEMRAAEDLKATRDTADVLRQANVFYQAGNFLSCVQRYQHAVGLLVKDETLARQLSDNMMNAGYRILAADDLASLGNLRTDAEKRRAILSRLHAIKGQYAAAALLGLQPAGTEQPTGQALASLLQARILLRQIVESEPVRTQYPDLGTSIDQYFAAVERQGQAEGRADAIAEVALLFDGLAPTADPPGKASPPQASPAAAHLSQSSPVETADPVLAVLDRLVILLGDR